MSTYVVIVKIAQADRRDIENLCGEKFANLQELEAAVRRACYDAESCEPLILSDTQFAEAINKQECSVIEVDEFWIACVSVTNFEVVEAESFLVAYDLDMQENPEADLEKLTSLKGQFFQSPREMRNAIADLKFDSPPAIWQLSSVESMSDFSDYCNDQEIEWLGCYTTVCVHAGYTF